ncbi:hypothetical protein PQR12_31045 [Paraburkholderia nemoris]|uniref:hypothetical protein n=1 Tax=Paraburkholderia nemoris TaxID=2793076 RepID=UPI0038B7226C
MTTLVNLSPTPMQRFVDSNGNALVGGQLFTYQAGTTTPAATYTDSTGNTQNTNPIILNQRGEASIWLSPLQSYKYVLSPANDTNPPTSPIWTQDHIQPPGAESTGNMTDEIGSNGHPGFAANTDFTPGTTTSLTLSSNYGSAANLWIAFDADEQGADTYSLTGTTLTFNAPIPVGVSKVFVKGGTTQSIGTPATGSVTDTSVAAGTALYNRMTEMVSVMDPLYGAKGDGTTDDTLSIQACIAANPYVFFPPGKTFKTTATIAVPATCFRIDGAGAQMVGPWTTTNGSTVNGFSFTNFNQGGGNIITKPEKYVLPSVTGYQYGVYLDNAAFLDIECDTILNVLHGWFLSANGDGNTYCFENKLTSRFIFHCHNTAKTIGSAFYLQSAGSTNNAFQGNVCSAFYVDDVFAGVYQEFSSSGTNGNINNFFDLTELDQSAYAVYCSGIHTSSNFYRFTAGITSKGNPNMFVNLGEQDMCEVGGTSFADPTFTGFSNFQQNGCSNRPGILQYAGGTLTVYVNASTGSDSLVINPVTQVASAGTGNQASPFATIQHALNYLQNLDLFGQTAFIAVADGTYSAGATYQGLGGNSCAGSISIIGDTANPGNVIVNGAFAANGSSTNLTVSGMTINGGVIAQNGGILNIGPSVVFGTNVAGAHVQAQFEGTVNINTNYTVTGPATYHYLASLNGIINNAAATAVTFSGTLPFTVVVQASQGAQISVPGITYTGASVSGTKYGANLNGVVYTGGGGANYFPGTVAGSTATGGQYA